MTVCKGQQSRLKMIRASVAVIILRPKEAAEDESKDTKRQQQRTVTRYLFPLTAKRAMRPHEPSTVAPRVLLHDPTSRGV